MVRSITLEVRWHNVCPIYSCHFQSVGPAHLKRVLDHNAAQAAGLPLGKSLSGEVIAASAASSSKHALPPIMPGGQSWRLATAGGDNNARIWMVHPNMPSPAAMAAAASTTDPSMLPAPHPPRVEYLATLSRHTGVVNVVRFCPRGELLATAGDDGNVLFWIPSDKLIESMTDDPNSFEKEHWRVRTMTRPTNAEIYDLAWSPSGEQLIVGGTDFALRVINAVDGSILREISEHSHHIQGVAWDPLNEFLATQSSDRSVHVHQILPRGTHNQAHVHGHALESHSSFAGLHNVSRNSHLSYHRRTGSTSASSVSHTAGSAFVWDHSAKPPMQRRGSSHASIASESGADASADPRSAMRGRSGRSSTPFESAIAGTSTHLPPSNQLPGTTLLSPSMVSTSLPPVSGPPPVPAPMRPASASASGAPISLPPPAGNPPPPTSANSITMGHAGRSVTPTPAQSVPPSPFSSASAMNPPQLTPSRRSSFSGSAIDAPSPPMTAISVGSTTHGGTGTGTGTTHSAAAAGSVASSSQPAPSASGIPTPSASWTPATSVSAATHSSSVPKPPPSNASVSSATGGGGGATASGFELRRSESRARSARSSSPMPLPAIRAPPSPKQRLQHVLGSSGAASSGGMGGGNGPYGASSANLSFSGSGIGQILRTRMYGDENYSGFFRRLSFSPDGALLVTPSGVFEGGTGPSGLPLPPPSPTAPLAGGGSGVDASPTGGARASSAKPANLPAALGGPAFGPGSAAQLASTGRSTVFMYARGSLHRSNAPIAHFPGHKTATLVVSFSPILYELRHIRRPGDASGGGGGGGADDGVAPHLTIPLEAGKHKVVPLSSVGRAFSGTATAREEDAAPLPPARAVPPPGLSSSSSSSDLRRPSSSQSSTTTGSVPPPDSLGGAAKPSSSATMPSPSTPAPAPSGAVGSAQQPPLGPPSMIGLPYRMVFAVATQESVWIYDTQQTGPLCCFSNMHYASFTDLSWSPDGQTLVMSSTDGYCSVVVFDYGELGTPYGYAAQPALAHVSGHAAKKVEVSPRAHHASAHPYAGQSSFVPSPSPASTPSSASATAASFPGRPAAAPASETPIKAAPASSSAGATGGLGLALPDAAAASSNSSDSAAAGQGEEQPKKKRRIALTTVVLP
ncbi:Chromatin assembly factor 1 subunit [Tilletia horrida]|nr:Chromatin assembly factor 1 subunit [Tilletia horrida]